MSGVTHLMRFFLGPPKSFYICSYLIPKSSLGLVVRHCEKCQRNIKGVPALGLIKVVCVSPGPLRSRCQDRIRHARDLLEELPVRKSGEGAGGD